MVVLRHARHRFHFHAACCGPQPQIHGPTLGRAAAVRSLEPGRKEVERAANPQTTLETRYLPNVADVPEYERGDAIFGHRRDRRGSRPPCPPAPPVGREQDTPPPANWKPAQQPGGP